MKNIQYLSLMAGLVIMLAACEGSEYELQNQIPEQFHKIISMRETGKKNLTVYNTANPQDYSIIVLKGGSDPSLTASATLEVLTQEQVDSKYSNIEGVDYRVIPSNAYVIDQPQLNFEKGERYKKIKVTFIPREIQSFLDDNPGATAVLPLILTSQTDSVNLYKKEQFLQLELVVPTIGFTTSEVIEHSYIFGRDLPPVIVENAEFKLDIPNLWEDIKCEFAVSQDYLESYIAAQGGLAYQLMPEGSYSFASQGIIANGSSSSTLPITINTENLLPGAYMLPVELKSLSSDFTISEGKNVFPIIVIIGIDGTRMDRIGWLATASSEERGGEGPVNGYVTALLDGDPSTFWHSRWSGGSDPLPHEIIIDTQKEHSFSKFSLIRRSTYNYVKAGAFYVSQDGNNWSKVGVFKMADSDSEQEFNILPASGRYIKITITESYNPPYACLAEFYAFGI